MQSPNLLHSRRGRLIAFGTLQVDFGLEQTEIVQLSIMNPIAGGSGCLAGGMLGDRFGINRKIATFYALSTAPTPGRRGAAESINN